jgi:hypothetical protein
MKTLIRALSVLTVLFAIGFFMRFYMSFVQSPATAPIAAPSAALPQPVIEMLASIGSPRAGAAMIVSSFIELTPYFEI